MAIEYKFTRVERKIVNGMCQSHVVGLTATDGVNNLYVDTEVPCGMMLEMCTEEEIIKCLSDTATNQGWYASLEKRLADMVTPVVVNIGSFAVTINNGVADITKE